MHIEPFVTLVMHAFDICQSKEHLLLTTLFFSSDKRISFLLAYLSSSW